MNIQRLLKKLDKNSIQSKNQLFLVQTPYNLKTSQSIGTVNQVGDQNQRSFVISDNMTPLNNNRKRIYDDLSANSKLDEELSNIQKMKNLYQSRQCKNKKRTKSIQKNSASGQKSLEKHLLKPSNTPSFNKFHNIKIPAEKGDSACKNLYTQKILQNSQISQVEKGNSQIYSKAGNKKSNKNIYQYPQSSFHIEQHEQQPYEQQPSMYNEQSLSQIANVSQDLPHDLSNQKLQQKQEQKEQPVWKADSRSNMTNIYSYRSPREKAQGSISKFDRCSCQCISRQQYQNIVNNFQQKYKSLTNRIDQLQKQNKSTKNEQKQLKQEHIKYQLALIQANDQKQRLQLQFKKQEEEKKQLQLMLKDVLYKRQRQRMQSSKQNTERQNQKRDRRSNNNFSFAQSQSTVELKGARHSIGSGKQSESKMKVQNLLNKLHIKVDRV